MQKSLFKKILSVISKAPQEKPWITASTISRRLNKQLTSEKVEQLLLNHCSECDEEGVERKVRYSSLPSRTSLELLWGDIKKVKDRKLGNITKDDIADDSLKRYSGEFDQPDIFVSHSHKDYLDVLIVAHLLIEKGVVPWLAETHIQKGEGIHQHIINAINSTKFFLLFLTPNALESQWTGKEFSFAVNNRIPIFVVVKVDDESVLNLFDFFKELESLQESSGSRNGKKFMKSIAENSGNIRFFLFAKDEKFNKERVGELSSFPMVDELPESVMNYKRVRG